MRKVFKPTAEQAKAMTDATLSQEKQGASMKVFDANFHVWQIPIVDKLVYISRIPVVEIDGAELYQPLEVLLHDCHPSSRVFYTSRCINGLSDGVWSEELGYDGECPLCEAAKKCWELYNIKYPAMASAKGLDITNDSNEDLKTIRGTLLKEFAVKNAERFVVLPIVEIPNLATTPRVPSEEASHPEKLIPYYMVLTKARYETLFLEPLEDLAEVPPHIGGLVALFKYSYKLEAGKVANVRDAGKAFKVTVLPNQSAFVDSGIVANCEEAVKEYTAEKAQEVLCSVAPMYKDELDVTVDQLMLATNITLCALSAKNSETDAKTISGGTAPVAGITANSATNSPEASLANFGAVPVGDVGTTA